MNRIILSLVAITTLAACQKDDVDGPSSNADALDRARPFTVLTPPVITPHLEGDVLIETNFPGVTLGSFRSAWGDLLPMSDNGENGDRVASDQIFSVRVSAAKIRSVTKAEDVNRPFVGTISIPTGGFISVFAEVYTGNIPTLVPERISDKLQMTPHLVNLVSDEISVDLLGTYTGSFYEHFSDKYDFLTIVMIGYNLNRHHITVKSTVMGIGATTVDRSSEYGSAGKLQGLNVFPGSYYFDGAGRGYIHEFGHQWVNFMFDTPLKPGIPHWPLSDLASGVMGWSASNGQGLEFNYSLQPDGDKWKMVPLTATPKFNDLELYLMGLIPPSEVSEHFVFNNQDQTAALQARILSGPITRFTVADLIAVNGERQPSVAASQKQFSTATIIISPKFLSAEEMSFYDFFAHRAESTSELAVSEGYGKYLSKPLFVATGGKASVTTTVTK